MLYFDHAATTPIRPEVIGAMQPWLAEGFGNPSSLYSLGRHARLAIDTAREAVAGALGCEFGEAIFTSGGTEAVVLGIVGTALAAHGTPRHRILMSKAEHPCALGTQEALSKLGFVVDWIDVDAYGRPDLNHFEDCLTDEVLLVVTMHANNETGSYSPVEEIVKLARRWGVLTMVDAVQTFGNRGWQARELEADLVAVSGHKIGGPKGVGALRVKAGTKLSPMLRGGGQERELRGGTENVAAIVGLGEAVKHVDQPDARQTSRDAFLSELARHLHFQRTLPIEIQQLEGHAHLRIPGVSAETLLIRLDQDGVCASSGSACSSGSIEPSHVLLAMGWEKIVAKEALRFTFGWTSTPEEAIAGARLVANAVEEIRRASSS